MNPTIKKNIKKIKVRNLCLYLSIISFLNLHFGLYVYLSLDLFGRVQDFFMYVAIDSMVSGYMYQVRVEAIRCSYI